MALFGAGQRLTADLLNDNAVEDTITTGLVAATNFTVVTFSGRRVNGFTTIDCFLQRDTSAISEAATNTGNIADTSLCTLPADWRPPEDINAVYGNGSVDGECTVSTTGVITLRSISGNAGIAVSTNVRVTAFWISG